jgi:hypothetical protein
MGCLPTVDSRQVCYSIGSMFSLRFKAGCALAAFALFPTIPVFGETNAFCSKSPTLLSAPKARKPLFSLHVSLGSYSRFRAKVTNTTAISGSETAGAGTILDEQEPLWSDSSLPGDNLNVNLNYGNPTQLNVSPKSARLPRFLSWLHGWRMEKDRGLFRPLRAGKSRVAFAYSDIFETRGNPEKGGHGLSILFRKDFGKSSGPL